MADSKLIKSHPCPNCQHIIAPSSLIQKPFRGKQKWYGMTPAPTQHCPNCQVRLQQVGWHKGALALAMGCFLFILLSLIFDFSGKNILTFIGFVIAVASLLFSQHQTYYQQVHSEK